MMNSGHGKSAQSFSAFSFLTPIWAAFMGSAILSTIAIATGTTLNRDGMLYVDTARVFLKEGLPAAIDTYAWPFLSILMAMVSHISGLDIENSGHLLNVLFMAGACALLVASSTRIFPDAGWPTCLTLLAIPGLNDYRNELLREYGCWFFVMLSFWFALRWAEAPRWRTAFLAQTVLVLASLFRPEALAFLPALILWQVFEASPNERARRLLMISSLSILALVCVVTLLATGFLPQRLVADFSRISLERFNLTAQAIAPGLHQFSRENVGTILFFGSLAIIPIKFVKMMGLFMVPLLYAVTAGSGFFPIWVRLRVFAWAFIAHLLVLTVFVVDMQFLAGRYVVLLVFLAAPLTGYGLSLVLGRFPRWKAFLISIAAAMVFANVISIPPGKQHFVDAGRWLAENAIESPRVYNESARSAYYAGWRYRTSATMDDRKKLREAIFRQQYDFVVLEASRKVPLTSAWLGTAGLKEIKRFSHPNGDAVVVAIPDSTRGASTE